MSVLSVSVSNWAFFLRCLHLGVPCGGPSQNIIPVSYANGSDGSRQALRFLAVERGVKIPRKLSVTGKVRRGVSGGISNHEKV